MLTSFKRMRGWTLHAVDGDIGRVDDLYFDDERWVVRYLIVDTGGWLRRRKVLISPYSVKGLGAESRSVTVSLTREQVETGPDIDTDKPVSRQQEAEYLRYYGYPEYWPYTTFWAWGAMPVVVPPDPEALKELQERRARDAERAALEMDVHLRSAREVTGYHIQGTDEAVGHVEDFLFEDDTWAIRYVVADTRNWLPGKHVLIATQWISEVSWPERTVTVTLTRAQIESSPPYDPSVPLTRRYETDLHRHYDRPGYWGS